MKRLFAMVLAVLLVLPMGLATSVGSSVGVDITTENFAPKVWLCDDRVLTDDNVQQGRNGDSLAERQNNYAFEGEKIQWKVLVMDKNGIEKVKDVFVTLGDTQGAGNDIEANCVLDTTATAIPEGCEAKILEEDISTFNPEDMAVYTCTLTVESSNSMHGEYWVTVEADDLDDLSGTFDENEYWFFNPTIALSVDGSLTFSDVRPGTTAYSDTLLVGNDAEAGSGVILDMFISGTDFYDPTNSGAKCPTTNQLSLDNFRYYAVNGAWSTKDDQQADSGFGGVVRNLDSEGYVNINYGDHWDSAMYKDAEIIQANPINGGDLGYAANLLAPGAEIAMTFKLSLPEPCNGDFSDGQINFWGEAV